MRKRIIFVHPVFKVRGGAEKVLLDMISWSKEKYEPILFALFEDEMITKAPEFVFASKDILFSRTFGYKANPFIGSHIKKLAKKMAETCSKEDIFILSNFPASVIFYEAVKRNKELENAKAFFLCFEPDRILYNKESEKLGFLPKDLTSLKYRIGSLILRRWKRRDYAAVTEFCRKIITLSRFVDEQAKQIYHNKETEKIFEHYTYLLGRRDKKKSLRRINEKFTLNLSGNDLIFLSLGRLEEGKGIETLLDVFKDLSGKYSNLKLVIGGRGALKDLVEAKSKQSGNIHYLGFVPDEYLKDVYAASDVFAFLGIKETGGPLTIIEAMANHLTVLVPDDGGAAYEIIKNGVNGFITSHDRESVVSNIEKIIKAKAENKLEKIKSNAYDWVERYATAQKAKEDFLKFLGKV